jgi:uncharacterized membrane protein YcaP (DUF421 family)
MVWTDLFVPGVPVIEKVLRSIIVYIVLLAIVRIAGKREFAQLNAFDLIVLLTLSNTVQNAIIGNDNSLIGGVIGAFTLVGVNSLVVRFMYRHEKIDRLIEGDPVTLVRDGHILKDCLDKELITVAELEAAAHRQGFASLEDVGRAVLEPGGTLSFIGRSQPGAAPVPATHEQILLRLDEIKQMVAARG